MFSFYPLIHWFLKQRYGQIQHWIAHPIATQQRVFEQLLQAGKATEWGRSMGLQTVHTPDQFRRIVRIQDYESLKGYIDRCMIGEPNVLWPTTFRWFAKSSGTTSERSKFIPVSKEAMEECHYKGAMDLLCCYLHAVPQSKLLSGKGLIVGGSWQASEAQTSAYVGDLSAVLMQNMSFYAQWYRTPELSLALLDRWEEKVERMAQAVARENITNMSGVPTWTLLLAQKVLELKNAEDLLSVWPHLELFIHGGVNFAPYRASFERLIPSKQMHYMEVYNASEGFFAFSMSPGDEDLLLHLDCGVYYEFLPESEFYCEQPKTCLLEEVETGQNYALVITTNGGLWRYQLGDTIQFTSRYPFRIRISGRVKHFINAFGEEVVVENAERALEMACRHTGAQVRDFTVAPIYLTLTQKGCHEWLIEFEQPPSDLNRFGQLLDTCLRSLNSDYDAKRQDNLALLPPQIVPVPPNTFYRWLKSKNKLGGQNKVPRLQNNRALVEEIYRIIHTQPV